jgi:hypothetical protein
VRKAPKLLKNRISDQITLYEVGLVSVLGALIGYVGKLDCAAAG